MSHAPTSSAEKPIQLEKFKLGKGVTKEGKYEYIELEVKLPEGATDKDFETNFMTAEYLIDSLMFNILDVKTPNTTPGVTPGAPSAAPALPKLLMSMEEFEAQGWKASQWVRKDDKDRAARAGEDSYMPTLAADKRLIQMINGAPNRKLELPPYEVSYAGDGGLIVRKGPHAKKR